MPANEIENSWRAIWQQGLTLRQIGKLTGKHLTTVGY